MEAHLARPDQDADGFVGVAPAPLFLQLPEWKHRQLRRLNVDIDVQIDDVFAMEYS